MDCPICGRETSENAKRCPNCGTKFKALTVSMLPKQERKPLRWQRMLPFAAIFLVLVLGVGLLWLFPDAWPPSLNGSVTGNSSDLMTPPQPSKPESVGRHIPYTGSIEAGNLGSYCTVICAEQSWKLEKSMTSLCRSMDGTVGAILMDDGSLYVVKDGTLAECAQNVLNYKVSVNGKGIAYITDGGAGINKLCLYSVDKAQAYDVSYLYGLEDYCISPDGQTLAYRSAAEMAELWIYDTDAGSQLIDTCQDSLLAVSNGGELIYTRKSNGAVSTLSCYISGQIHLITVTNSSFWLNAEHNELLFSNSYGSYVATADGEKHLLSSYKLSPVLPNNAQSMDSLTLPFESFYGHLYTTPGARTMLYISETEENRLRFDNAPEVYYLEANGEYLFYQIRDKIYFRPVRYSNIYLLTDAAAYGSLQISPCRTGEKQIRYSYTQFDALYYGSVNMDIPEARSCKEIDSLPTFHVVSGTALYYIKENNLWVYNGVSTKLISESAYYVECKPNGYIYSSRGMTDCILIGDSLKPFNIDLWKEGFL